MILLRSACRALLLKFAFLWVRLRAKQHTNFRALSIPTQHDENSSQPPITAVMRKTKRSEEATKLAATLAPAEKKPRKAFADVSNEAQHLAPKV